MVRKPITRKKRSYSSAVRAAGAASTREAILEAARRRFVEDGFGGMKMDRIAADAGVALDTVYAVVGPKPMLVKLLVETAISGADVPVTAEERDYVQRIHAAADAREKLGIYAGALALIHRRLAPIVRALRDAAPAHEELASLWRDIAARRRKNMSVFARELAATGQLRPKLSQEELADTLWTMSAPELYMLFVHERGWPPERFAAWLGDAWARLFLADGR